MLKAEIFIKPDEILFLVYLFQLLLFIPFLFLQLPLFRLPKPLSLSFDLPLNPLPNGFLELAPLFITQIIGELLKFPIEGLIDPVIVILFF